MEPVNREFFDPMTAEEITWEPVANYPPGARQKILYDGDSRSSRLLQVDPGVRTDSVAVHDYHEEVLVLEGELVDVTLDETFTVGMYAYRTPGMEHGPYEYPERCLMFEHRYRE